MRLIHVILRVLFIVPTIFGAAFLESQVERQCVQQCSLQNRTESHYALDCEHDCNQQCESGCSLWSKALNSTCMSACNTTNILSAKQLYCVMGCNDAVTIYISQLRSFLGTPPPPALVADSLTSNSLKLEWNYKKPDVPGLKYLVQWKYEEHSASWQFYKNQSLGLNHTIFTVNNLQPYTKYRFRVAIILFQSTEHVTSAQSVVIMTLPAGVPISPPSSVRAVPVDCTRISVSWEPGPFPNGPILSYVVRITDNDISSYSALKDIPAEKNFYMFTSLKPGKRYNVSISMSNGVGTGPAAYYVVRTPRESAVKDTQGPVLIIGTEHEIVEQGVDIMDEPVTLYYTEHHVKIKGVAIHVKYNLLFISDSDRYIHRMPLSREANLRQTAILSPNQLAFHPLDLSIDWLNEQLYILGEVNYERKMWTVTRCGLDGRGLTVAVAGLTIKPHHIEVDSYNGYLFWIIHDGNKSGLYRLDLADISNGIKHEIKPELIFSEPNLGAFIVDHTNFLLLVSNQNNKTVNSVSLDGKEVSDARPKIRNSILQKVISIATANKKFYWTDGNQVFFEEYHPNDEIYFHNSFNALMKESYLKVIINLPISQPVPVPINPPTSMQAIFGSNRAKTTWKPPHLLGGQGKGAWQNWSYEISVKDLTTNEIRTYQNINTTSYTIHNLKEDTEYIIKAAAYTSSGKGPWSSEFKGRSLKISRDGKHPTILWSASEGLLKSDATGENVETLIHQSLMKDYYFMDTAWYEDKIYLVSNTSQIFWYNITTHKHGKLTNIDSVGSISIDWIGKKLYWSNPKQQLIMRGSLSGIDKEPLPILTIAKELIVDPIKAYLYWSTLYAVECSRLNGAERIIYHSAQLFSGKQVMGLTLDIDHQYVYWIVRGSEGSNLFRAPMAGSMQLEGTLDEKVTSLQKPDMQGPLCYFNNRLLWLQDDKNAVISNLEGGNIAVVNGKSLSGLNMVYIIDSTLNVLPNSTSVTLDNISVVPEVVDVNSVEVIGSWESFNITWMPVRRVNYGDVFYEIKIESNGIVDPPVTTTTSSIKYWHVVPPFSEMQVQLRAFTYWGSSTQIRLVLHSPSSTPSEPENLRAYITYSRHHSLAPIISATVRWDKPTNSNGVIQSYKISCWYIEEGERQDVCVDAEAPPDAREYVLNDLLQDEIYYFQVQAFTNSAGPSSTVQVNTSVESPLPTLLVASTDSIFIQDIDSHKNKYLLHGISTPVEIAYLIKENKLFWLNDMKELFVYNIENDSKSKITDLNGTAVSLTVDWLERSLYYVQANGDAEGSSLYKLDLNHFEKGLMRSVQIFRTPAMVSKIEVSPFTKKLYWVEADQNHQNRLMQCNTDGSGIEPFFVEYIYEKVSAQNGEDVPCNCPIYPVVEKTFTIDHSDYRTKPLLIFIDASTREVISSEKEGCYCEVLANSSLLTHSMPLRNLKSDFSNLYWTNSTRGLVYYTMRRSSASVTSQEQVNAQDMLIFGPHMQPFPPKKCLTPKFNRNITVSLVRETAHSLILKMPDFKIHPECRNISMATIEYRIYYMPYNEEDSLQCDETCTRTVTFDKIVEINGLRPYSKYLFSVGVSNYYSNLKNENGVYIGRGIVFQTAVGAPSEPQNITVTVLNPTLVRVTWLPPKEFNGDTIYYEIHWQTEGTISGIRQKGEQMVMDNDIPVGASQYSAFLQKLSPNESYLVWVRAYSQTNETSSDSTSVKITTFPEPDNITVINYTAYTLQAKWNVSKYTETFVAEYAPLTSNEWEKIQPQDGEGFDSTIELYIENLKPKTQYKFRFLLTYPNYEDQYVWPKDSRFTFETLGDRPSPPGKPEVRFVSGNESKVWWEPSRENGSPILLYKLEGMKLKNYRERRSTNRSAWFHTAPSVEEQEFEWEQFYNGTETYWKISGLSDEYRYAFRALALNDYGWSDPSEDIEFDPTTAALLAEKPDPLMMILIAICIPLSILVALLICVACCKWNCNKNKKSQHVIAPIRGPDVELATLRELPRRGNFVHNTNVLYVSAQPTAEEITLLPHIRRDQITLMKFLGSGAFGEVFEGKAKGLTSSGGDTKVAVKALRKGASDQEKTEFLQEAQLMSHFKHKHILQLLGVCLDNDPHFIIMELMEGGDLLTYLRSSRKSGSNPPPLTLVELLKMCVDVATGCRYLEEMHFVHRDLACRNCLVSSTEPECRIVKIGDFGLARDIYKNDYYRKEGEGLLPVRWMAPESLVDGVFTNQSDVWAFGVLLWEIMTLGQQPYPARNNLEVLHYVRRGGRLGKPTDCPEILHDLMLLCWSYEAERRPTFKYCLETLRSLHEQTAASSSNGVHEGQYISTVPEQFEGVSNQTYFQDFNHNNSGASWKSEDSSRERTPFLQETPPVNVPTEIPTYLELVYDSDCPAENDGYEIPRSNIKTSDIRQRSSSPVFNDHKEEATENKFHNKNSLREQNAQYGNDAPLLTNNNSSCKMNQT